LHLRRLSRWLAFVALAMVTNVASAQDEVAMFCGVSVPWCEALARGFRADTGIVVNITFKDAADALANVAAEKDDPKHDVWYSGSGDSQLRAAETGLIDEYRSALLPMLHDWALHQGELSRGRAVGAHAAVVGIGYNSKALANKRLPEPRCWADLARPEYRNELHFANPSASRVGYMTLATLVQVFGEERAFELLKAMHRNASNYAITATGAIRAVARGEATIGVAMLHDGATEIANGFPVHLAVPCEGTGYDVGSIAIVTNAPHPANARRFYDWVLTPAAQRIAAGTRNFQYPANREAPSPAAMPDADNLRLIRYDFVKYATASERKRLLEKWERDVHAQPR
jgi:iron(III) transport system substrate-binding protein